VLSAAVIFYGSVKVWTEKHERKNGEDEKI
jgi:hypothetical protein